MPTVDGGSHRGIGAFPADAGLVPATSAQRGIWLSQAIDPASSAYHIGYAFDIAGPLDPLLLRRALQFVVDGHEALRSALIRLDGQLWQVVPARIEVDLCQRHDVAADEVVAAVDAELSRPFDLAMPPLFRAMLLTTGPQRHVLTIVAHHAVADWPSFERIWTDLADAYDCLTRTGQCPAAPDSLQFADYAAWESEWVRSVDYKQELDFFRERLRAAPAGANLPLADRPAAPWTGGTESLALPAELRTGLAAFARAHRVTAFIVLLTVFAGVLHRWTGQPMVVVGTPVSLRDRPELESMVGLLLNSVALPTTWTDDLPFAEALERVKLVTAECLSRRRVPFDQLVADLQPPRDHDRSPLFQIFFGQVRSAETGLRLPGLDVTAIPVRRATAKFEVTLNVVTGAGELRVDVEWSARRFDADTAALLGRHVHVALETVLRDPTARVGEWPLAQRAAGDGLAEALGLHRDGATASFQSERS
jgi:hypothetical protein